MIRIKELEGLYRESVKEKLLKMREHEVKAKFERSAVDHIELRLKQRTCHEHHLKPILS